MSKKDQQQILNAAKNRGWTIKRQGKHLVLTHAHHGTLVTSRTPSDHRAPRNLKARLRRMEQGEPPPTVQQSSNTSLDKQGTIGPSEPASGRPIEIPRWANGRSAALSLWVVG